MDEDVSKLLKKRAAKSKGRRLPHAVPDVINKSDLTPETVDVLEHFGLNAPDLLNVYATRVEDALIEQVNRVTQLRSLCIQLKDEVQRLRELVPEDVVNE